jgi:hypothetical protein
MRSCPFGELMEFAIAFDSYAAYLLRTTRPTSALQLRCNWPAIALRLAVIGQSLRYWRACRDATAHL